MSLTEYQKRAIKISRRPKHTPGPWHLTKNLSRIEIRTDPMHSYAFALEDEANARLIAAAPEMLDLLRTIIRKVDAGLVGSQNWYVWDKARAAIARAEGRSA